MCLLIIITNIIVQIICLLPHLSIVLVYLVFVTLILIRIILLIIVVLSIITINICINTQARLEGEYYHQRREDEYMYR